MTRSREERKEVFYEALRWQVIPKLLADVGKEAGPKDAQKTLLPNVEGGTLNKAPSRGALGEARRIDTEAMKPKKAPMLVEEDVATLVAMILDSPLEAVSAHLEEYLSAGHEASDLILMLLSPAAVMFGQRWTDDDLSFTEVTLGMAMLHSVLHRFSQRLQEEIEPAVSGATIMIAPYPGENHLFGASIVEEFMRADGWDVGVVMAESGAALVRKVRERHYDIVGLSLAHASQLAAMRQLIVSIRANSLNKRLAVIIGGPLVQVEPKLVSGLPVEGIATDARQGLKLARDLLVKVRLETDAALDFESDQGKATEH